jgi:hypothetical protein
LKLSIVMPTIAGREDELARTIAAYERLTPATIEWIVEHDHPTCAHAWNAGVAKATGSVVHCGNDDLEPESEYWFPSALRVLGGAGVPLGWVREDAIGTFGRDFTRVPMCRREWWVPLPNIHYYSDNAFGDRMAATGHLPVVAEGFDFYHRRSMVGRDETPERVDRDRRMYEERNGLHLRTGRS